MVDIGCVNINCWASRTRHIEYPDYISIDLDPTIDEKLKGQQRESAENDGFLKAVKVARETKKILDNYRLTSFIKTSGQTSLHIYIPCIGFTFTQTRNIAEHLAEQIHQHIPGLSTTSVSKNQRQDRVYIDAGQNDYADTLAAPYSVHPYHRPIVSTPLEWKEITPKLSTYNFTIDAIKQLSVPDDTIRICFTIANNCHFTIAPPCTYNVGLMFANRPSIFGGLIPVTMREVR
jgi:bifunctional non-homologous end joining protein LigD